MDWKQQVHSVASLAGLARSLLPGGALDLPGIPASDPAPSDWTENARRCIALGEDPLGEIYGRIRKVSDRRAEGATYTPLPIVRHMVALASAGPAPSRVVDPGTGSGRFLLEAGARFPDARLIGIELNPVAALLARANLDVRGLTARADVIVADYRRADLGRADGPTLFIGNPPYVRHHGLEPAGKEWLRVEAQALGLKASGLSGLHVHFILQTARLARPGDMGVFITAAEWLDVNYGDLVRRLLTERLGVRRMDLFEPSAMPFNDALTSAVIVAFEVGSRARSVAFNRISSAADLANGRKGKRFPMSELRTSSRWTGLMATRQAPAEGWIELGDLFRVRRGQVTGANGIWIENGRGDAIPDRFLVPAVTRAREIIDSGGRLRDPRALRRVIDLPEDLDSLAGPEREAVEAFLAQAKALGTAEGYIARHRSRWWSVGLYEPAPVLSTYMARRAPAFALNEVRARHLNIAHGLYPRAAFSSQVLACLVRYLNRAVDRTRDARTLAGSPSSSPASSPACGSPVPTSSSNRKWSPEASPLESAEKPDL